MLALRKKDPAYGAVLEEVPEPTTAEDIVIIDVDAVGVCGSDLHMYEWTPGYEWLIPALPVTMGHEFCGNVAEVGPGVTTLRRGERVVVMPSYSCSQCEQCRRGKPDLCANRKSVGLTVDGGFAPLVPVPARACIPIGDSLPSHIAALTEPLVIGDRAVEFGDIEPGANIVVLGPGIIGLSVAYIARRHGARSVTVVGKNDPLRLDIATKLGADRVIDLGQGSDRLADHIDERSIDRVFEATGFPDSITQGLGLLRDFGIMVAIGIHPAPAPIDITPFVRRKLQLRGSHSGAAENWERVLKMLPEAASDLEAIVTHQLPLNEAIEGFEMSRRREACKVVIRPHME
jgi:L-iditol 2-dehydrogenase